jgi:hypothetical protein
MWLIIKKPETSMPRSRAVWMCWAEMSASVQWVAIRTERTEYDGTGNVKDAEDYLGPCQACRGTGHVDDLDRDYEVVDEAPEEEQPQP